jgi:hypothetical protein
MALQKKLITDLWSKAYLIEFLDNGIVEDSFTFSVPPEQEEFTYAQRKTETKTFGGLHVDEYGIDAVKISLSGSTINQELKKIYMPHKSDKWMTGEEEIYFFRDLIKEYTSISYLAQNKNSEKKIMLYDLSKTNKRQSSNPNNSYKNIRNYWRVFLGDFKIRRGNDKPFTYKYTFECTGADPESEGRRITQYPNIGSFDINKALDEIDEAFEKLNDTLSWMEGVSDKISEVRQKAAGVKAVYKALSDGMNGYLDTFTEGINSIVNESFGLYDDLTRGTIVMMADIGLDFQNSCLGLLGSVENFTSHVRGIWEDPYIPQEIVSKYQTNSYEFQDTINLIMNKSEDGANSIVAVSKSVIPEITPGQINPQTGKPNITLSYGSMPVEYTQNDNFESLAKRYFGDPDRAIDIAAYNGVASLSELSPGDILLIPILNYADANRKNLIYARQGDHDTYGRDISLADDGSIEVSGTGDFKLVGGNDNLSQGILLRLRENVDKRIRINTYGIRTNISDPDIGVAYILSSIDMTIKADPRVKTIDNIQFKGLADGLFVEVFYTDKNDIQGQLLRKVGSRWK